MSLSSKIDILRTSNHHEVQIDQMSNGHFSNWVVWRLGAGDRRLLIQIPSFSSVTGSEAMTQLKYLNLATLNTQSTLLSLSPPNLKFSFKIHWTDWRCGGSFVRTVNTIIIMMCCGPESGQVSYTPHPLHPHNNTSHHINIHFVCASLVSTQLRS